MIYARKNLQCGVKTTQIPESDEFLKIFKYLHTFMRHFFFPANVLVHLQSCLLRLAEKKGRTLKLQLDGTLGTSKKCTLDYDNSKCGRRREERKKKGKSQNGKKFQCLNRFRILVLPNMRKRVKRQNVISYLFCVI